MPHSIKYSIIIPCYNSGLSIKTAIDSICTQRSNNFEIICIDDGSTDNTLDILEELQKENKPIQIFKNDKNRGVSFSRNRGIKEACGEYVIFLDSDDIYLDGLFKELLEVSHKTNPDIISFGYSRGQGGIKREKEYVVTKLGGIHKGEYFLKQFLKRNIFQHICTIAIKLDLIRKFNIEFNEQVALGEDIAFQIKVMSISKNIYYIPTVYFRYVFNSKSVSNAVYSKKHLSCTKNYYDIKNFFDKNNIRLIKYLNFYYQFIFFYELRFFLYSKEEYFTEYIKSDYLLSNNCVMTFNKTGLKLLLLKIIYKRFPNFLFLLLKKYT